MAGAHSSLGRRAFFNFVLPAAALAVAPFNANARETVLNALKRYVIVPDDAEVRPPVEDQSTLVADLILDALDRDRGLRAEIIEWLASEYLAECQAIMDETAANA